MDGHLLYDADCGFCTAAARWLQARGMRAIARPLQRAEPSWGLDEDRAVTEIPFRHADGDITWGARAMADALLTCGGILHLLGRSIGSRPGMLLARPAYKLMARYRHRLPGGTAECELPRN